MDVVAAVFRNKDSVLLMRRASGHSGAGGWEYPGGKIEPGETGEQALKRELSEELKITAFVGPQLAETTHQYDDRQIHLIAYEVISYEGNIALTDHDAMEWVPVDKLLDHDQLPADKSISEQIISGGI